MNLTAWAGSVCVSAAGCTALHMLVENKGIGKTLRLVTVAFFLCAVLLPLVSLPSQLKGFSADTQERVETEALEDTALRQMKSMTERLLLAEVNEALAAEKIVAESIEIRMDISDVGSISITDIVLYIPPGNSLHRTRAAEAAAKRLGMEVHVEYAE